MFEQTKSEQKQTDIRIVQKEKKGNKSMPSLTGALNEKKTSYENHSGFSFGDVISHHYSDKPAQLQALAYTHGISETTKPVSDAKLLNRNKNLVQKKARHSTIQMRAIDSGESNQNINDFKGKTYSKKDYRLDYGSTYPGYSLGGFNATYKPGGKLEIELPVSFDPSFPAEQKEKFKSNVGSTWSNKHEIYTTASYENKTVNTALEKAKAEASKSEASIKEAKKISEEAEAECKESESKTIDAKSGSEEGHSTTEATERLQKLTEKQKAAKEGLEKAEADKIKADEAVKKSEEAKASANKTIADLWKEEPVNVNVSCKETATDDYYKLKHNTDDEDNVSPREKSVKTGTVNLSSQRYYDALHYEEMMNGKDKSQATSEVLRAHPLPTGAGELKRAGKPFALGDYVTAGNPKGFNPYGHEAGHMFGLGDEYIAGGSSAGDKSHHYALTEKAFGTSYADKHATRQDSSAVKDHEDSIMNSGTKVKAHHYVTFWDAMVNSIASSGLDENKAPTKSEDWKIKY